MNGIDRLLLLKEENAARGDRMAAMRPRFLELAQRHELGTAPRAVIGFNLFQTPRPIAAQMAARLLERVGEGARLLEPSAGLGRLYEPLADLRARWEMVEEAGECCEALRKALTGIVVRHRLNGIVVRQRDFLTVGEDEIGGNFDGIVMNPPFKQGRDIRHILRAAELLAPGGRLVGLCYNGVRQREALKPIVAEWVELPPRSFREEGTDADVAMVVIDR